LFTTLSNGNHPMAWLYLILAGVCEIAWAIGLKYTDGFRKLWPSVWTVTIMLLSFWLLAQAMKTLPVGTAYAIWTGIGAVGTAILGIVLFHESRDVMRIVCIGVIVTGIVGLKFFSPSNKPAPQTPDSPAVAVEK
jgi:quaternary ammonium compound-resistance protein SugE